MLGTVKEQFLYINSFVCVVRVCLTIRMSDTQMSQADAPIKMTPHTQLTFNKASTNV